METWEDKTKEEAAKFFRIIYDIVDCGTGINTGKKFTLEKYLDLLKIVDDAVVEEISNVACEIDNVDENNE